MANRKQEREAAIAESTRPTTPSIVSGGTGVSAKETMEAAKAADLATANEYRAKVKEAGKTERAPRPDRSRIASESTEGHGALSTAQRAAIKLKLAVSENKRLPTTKSRFYGQPDIAPEYGNPHKKSGRIK